MPSASAAKSRIPRFRPIEQTGQPLEFSFDYTREKFGEWDNQRISPPLPAVGWELVPGVKQIKPADDIEIGSPGDQQYTATVQLPSGWLLFPPQSVDLTEDWAEYHSKYKFSDGVFTAERHLLVKKDKVPLADWNKYLAFRRSIYEDEVRMDGIMNPAAPPGASAASYDTALSGIRADILQAMIPMRDVLTTLMADPAASGDDLKKAANGTRDSVQEIESKSAGLPASDEHSLFWSAALAAAWGLRGWSALATNDLTSAENYLRAAWRLNPDLVSGYLLGRVLEARGEKAAAAHQYELASISDAQAIFSSVAPQVYDMRQRIADAYRRVSGKELTATPLNHGAYSGSLQEELDRASEIHQFVHSTQLTGDGWFVLSFEAGKPMKASFLSGDRTFSSLVPLLQAHAFAPQLPAGSKAVLLREARIACSPWAGCDVYLEAASKIRMPSETHVFHAVPVPPPKETKTVRIEGVHP